MSERHQSFKLSPCIPQGVADRIVSVVERLTRNDPEARNLVDEVKAMTLPDPIPFYTVRPRVRAEEQDNRLYVMHLNIVSRYLSHHPDWRGDVVPLCTMEEVKTQDHFTINRREVTCLACVAEMKSEAQAKAEMERKGAKEGSVYGNSPTIR